VYLNFSFLGGFPLSLDGNFGVGLHSGLKILVTAVLLLLERGAMIIAIVRAFQEELEEGTIDGYNLSALSVRLLRILM
jgi:hypothetical protein